MTVLPILIQRMQWTSGCKIFTVGGYSEVYTRACNANSIRGDALVNFTN